MAVRHPGESSPARSIPILRCRVCGSRSTGVHYGVVACEGCKAFYKRGLTKSVDYKCYFGGSCVVGPTTGGRCKACRFQKCVQVGMNLQATRMGRTPKLKMASGRCPSDGHGNSSMMTTDCEIRQGVRKIAPAPVKSTFNMSATLMEGNFGNWTGGATLTQILPINAANSSDVTSLYSSPPSSGTSLERKSETHEIPETPRPPTPLMVVSQRHTVNNMARFSPLTLDNMHRFHLDSGLLDSFPPDWKSSQSFTVKDNLSQETVDNLPSFLSEYWHVGREINSYVEYTIKTVADAAHAVFGDQLAIWDHFMHEAVTCDLVPHQPQHTVKVMTEKVRESMEDCVRRQCHFMFSLPGFTELDQADQRILFSEKYFEIWLIVHAPYFKNDEVYYLIEPDKIHCSYYWVKQLFEDDFVAIVFGLWRELNSVGLTRVESFLLIAVAVFNEDTTTVTNRAAVSFLHTHYLDCLLKLIRSRPNVADRTIIEDRLHKFMSSFRSISQVGNLYVRALDFAHLPLKAFRNGRIITVGDALSM